MSHDRLFSLRVRLGAKTLAVTAFDANHTSPNTGHMRIDVRAVLAGRVIFERGETYCAVNRWTAIDSDDAKELVLSLIAMKPGDTDAEYFANYTEDQLAFASEHGDEICMIAEERFGTR